MRFLLAAALLAGLSACPAAAQWDDDRPHVRRSDDGYGRRDADAPRFRSDDDDGLPDRDRRDRRAYESRDPDEIMPRRRDRDRDVDRGRDGRDRRAAESWRDDRFRTERDDRYGSPSYGPVIVPSAPPSPGGVFVVPPPIPGARGY
ncbi:hypothetical protein LRS73_16125 [Methylobacterium currus]|uniref:hypothetical protein n=1 Tax=Methylobacterium currus TaxID=2051553 RepID=UPI001E2FFE73|nr:hypothetical protein [Methylobacterium currus]UHC14105.1 hypothetical protein LRS73_16125 [Methylobacterium currus]